MNTTLIFQTEKHFLYLILNFRFLHDRYFFSLCDFKIIQKLFSERQFDLKLLYCLERMIQNNHSFLQVYMLLCRILVKVKENKVIKDTYFSSFKTENSAKTRSQKLKCRIYSQNMKNESLFSQIYCSVAFRKIDLLLALLQTSHSVLTL